MLGLSERSARFFSSANKKFCKISHIGTWGKTYETSPKLHMRALVFPLRGLYSTPIFSNKINTFVPLDRISIFGKTSTPYIQMLNGSALFMAERDSESVPPSKFMVPLEK